MTLDAMPYLLEQIRITADQIRTAWAWLELLVEPGHATTVARAVDDGQAERLEALGHADRAYRDWNLRHGMSALPPSPAAVRLGIVDAQVVVHQHVATAVRLLAGTGSNAKTWTRADVALQSVPTALDWLVGSDIGLGADGGGGVWRRQGAVDRIRDANLAAEVDKLLQRADRVAREATGDDGMQLRPLEHRCPACGRRSLQLDHESAHRINWLVKCVSQRCVCTGDATPDREACGCGKRYRRPGRPHVWTYAELSDGHHGLLDVVAAAARDRPGVGRGASGHGGWQTRDMAGQQ
ncbi:hypothetical protein HH310_12470 [Actinoplanes sp. TBRC 11911]|uniref:hypothetical protein n=1 Tax=Actinoplanes sp. TBRC 11911 TaxID=2729386 RepID=UPI00145EC3CB|nr:hypothetical protein [Actinoplanes sp. TBRC 11911]NMO52008.1 hypothetical protein [Actinoplanes sp. TBRC 11911]